MTAVLKIMGKSYVVDILEVLRKEPKRFVDLKIACKSSRTRAERLKALKREGIIDVVPKIQGNRAHLFYQLTPFGEKILGLAESMMRLKCEHDKKELRRSTA